MRWAADVREVNTSLIDLRIALERHTAAADARSRDLHEVRIEVFALTPTQPSRAQGPRRSDRTHVRVGQPEDRLLVAWWPQP